MWVLKLDPDLLEVFNNKVSLAQAIGIGKYE